jgi:putative PEP-CTERM system histidine kinase
MTTVKDFMNSTRASLLVPLLSSNRIVGVITVGADRSGRPYDWEAGEFLRALAGHAAGEFHKSELLATLVEAKEDEAFRAFSTFLLHDLKNFASTLSLIAQNAPRYQNNPDFQKDSFQSVYETAEKMKRLCNSLRTFSSNLAANKKLSDLNQIVRSVADTLNAGLQEHLRFDLGELPLLVVDAEELGRVIQNLLLNAREAISEDGVITVRTTNRGGQVEVAVEDNGKGMSQQFIEKELFLPFHTTKSGGLGIGLFHSKKIMEAHRGAILVESEKGKGTKVTLIFPAAKEEKIMPHVSHN